ncbi:MAG: desulfoferrodoxin family protein [Candidatus Eisenbacteria bacterium]
MLRGSRHIVALMVIAIAVAVAPLTSSSASSGVYSLYRAGDQRSEKHVPVIECPVEIKTGESTTVTVSVGKDMGHPNTAMHHIRWIRLYFLPADSTLPYEVGSFEFGAHGESVIGADTSTLRTDPKISVDVRTRIPGVFYATALCYIHGLWESAKAIAVAEQRVKTAEG